MKRDMEKEKTRGRTRRKQPSQVAGFLYREGRKWCAAALSLCMILNNMASVTWAAESAAEKEVLFKLTSRSLYEALQEAVREETMVDDHFLFEGKEKDVEAYEKLLLLDDDLYELKPEFENKDEVTNAEKKNDLQLRIFASLGWETDPEREYQVVGDEKIIFCLSNASETEQTAVIQVDEKTTEEIVLVPGSAVVIDSKSEEESLEAESGDERKDDEEQEETENSESEGQAEEENNSEGIKGVGGNSGAGGATGGNGGNSGNDSNGGNGSNSESSENSSEFSDSSNSGESSEKEDFVESGSSVENEGKADESAADIEENRNDETQEKADAEDKQDKENKNSQETVNKSENGNSQENTKEPENTNTQENANTQDKAEEKDERKDEEVKNNSTSEKEETERLDKTEAGSNESEKPDKAESGNSESEKTGKEESGNVDSGKADKPDKTDKSDNKESSKPETSEKSESGNTSTGKGEKSGTGKTENKHSGNSDSSKKSESSKDSSDSESSDNSSDKGKEVSEGISRNVIRLVADNLEVSASDDVEETEGAEETTIIDTQEKQKEETIEEESEEIKAETKEVKTETEEVKIETEEIKAENASPSNAEDDEIEGELYVPVAVNEESIIVFVTTAEELGLNCAELRKASDSNAKRISSAYEGEVELENVIVQVKADENVLPEGVKLQVKELKQEGEDAAQYEEAKEALDSQGTEYDGMMALDISFLDKKGREIEPDGNVQVSIKVKKEVLPEEADLESIAVQHLAEDEGEIFVEEVADCGNKTRGKVEVEAEEHVEAAFEVDSFSVFTVTWNDGMGYKENIVEFNLHFYSLGQNGVSTEITENLPEDKTMIISDKDFSASEENGSLIISMNDYFATAVQGYTYERTEFIASPYHYIYQAGYYFPDGGYVKRDPITGVADTIKIKKLNNIPNMSFYYLIEVYGEGGELLSTCPSDPFHGPDITLNVYYRESDIGIIATILEDGCLTVKRELEPGQSYVWYKWAKDDGNKCPTVKNENGDDIRNPAYQVSRRIVAGSKWNIEQNGKVLNAVHDGGANHYYLVAIKDNETGEEIMASHPFLIDYSDKLRNGSFETPVLSVSNSDSRKFYGFYQNGADGLEWKTTTENIEIVSRYSKGNDDESHFLEEGYVPDGIQCAELNAKPEDGTGALYQDVLTAPGTTLHWSLWHRARGNISQYSWSADAVKDTMYVIIMPTREVEEKMKESGLNVDELKKDIINNPQNYSDSTRVWELTSPRRWTFYTDDYVVGDGQYLTRFFFVAGDVASNLPTYGNLLDDIRFGTEYTPISQGGVLSLTKLISGLSAEDMKDYKITLRVTKTDGNYTKDISLKQFTSTEGIFSEAQNLPNLPAGEYSIEEVLPDGKTKPIVSMEQIERNDEGEEISTALDVKISSDGHSKATITIEEGKLTTIRITNSYTKELKGNFSIKKIFENGVKKQDDMGEKFKNVQFKLESVNDENPFIQIANMANKENISDTEDDKLSVDADNNLFGNFVFGNIPEGTYKLTELNTPDGYQTISPVDIYVGKVTQMVMEDGELVKKELFGCYVIDTENPDNKTLINDNGLSVENKEISSGAILPDTGGPGLAMFERYGWFLLMLALMMAGVEVRCYGKQKYKRAAVTERGI